MGLFTSRTAPSVSLAEVHGTVAVPKAASEVKFWKRLFAFGGPAYLVSVGYMDPGNWATDLQAGASFGYALIWVLVMSNMMALLLQTLSARLGIVAGRDLAQACRDYYPKPIAMALWVLCEIAIIACDLAEVLGTALGIYLLFGIPLGWGVLITALDVFVLLTLQRFGMKKLELFIISLVVLIGGCFVVEMFLAKPSIPDMATGLIPSLPHGALYVAIGIIGATVMPHNLYLHSALVQTRQFEQTTIGKKLACKFNFIDSFIALNGAFFINAGILILSSAVFFSNGIEVTEIEQAHELLSPLLGTALAGILFAVALLASGQSSTLTGTLAGQIVMEGFVRFRLRPAVRRMITRSLAIIPAAIVIWTYGEESTIDLLILSQVILSMQLSFAIIPLIHFTSDKQIMGEFANKLWVNVLAWLTAAIVLSLNIKLLYDKELEALASSGTTQTIGYIALPFLVGLVVLLLYILLKPVFVKNSFMRHVTKPVISYPNIQGTTVSRADSKYERVGVAIEGSVNDIAIIEKALSFADTNAEVVLIHVIGTASGFFNKEQSRDTESLAGENYLKELQHTANYLHPVRVSTVLGYGSAPNELIRIAEEKNIEILVMGSHGHRGLSDVLYGTTVSPVRHALNIPIFIVQ
jgi:manganese transport protein